MSYEDEIRTDFHDDGLPPKKLHYISFNNTY